MTDDVRAVLDALPVVKDAGQLIVLDAYLLNADDDCTRLAIGGVCLDFLNADITAVEERAGGGGPAIPVRIALRAGARPVRIGSSKAYEELIRRRHLRFPCAEHRFILASASGTGIRISSSRRGASLRKYGLGLSTVFK